MTFCSKHFLYCNNRISGKSMLKIKSTQIARECTSSYVEHLHSERIIAYDIVERNSNQNRAVGK